LLDISHLHKMLAYISAIFWGSSAFCWCTFPYSYKVTTWGWRVDVTFLETPNNV